MNPSDAQVILNYFFVVSNTRSCDVGDREK